MFRHDNDGEINFQFWLVCLRHGLNWIWQEEPDRIFCNFRASKSFDRQIICSSKELIGGFGGLKNMKSSVGQEKKEEEEQIKETFLFQLLSFSP